MRRNLKLVSQDSSLDALAQVADATNMLIRFSFSPVIHVTSNGSKTYCGRALTLTARFNGHKTPVSAVAKVDRELDPARDLICGACRVVARRRRESIYDDMLCGSVYNNRKTHAPSLVDAILEERIA